MNDAPASAENDFGYTLRHTGTVALGVVGALAALVVAGVSLAAGPAFVAALVTFAALSVVLLVRPSVRVGTGGVRIDNPFRRHVVPWPAYQDVASRWNLCVYGARDPVEVEIKAWALASRVTRPRGEGLLGLPGIRGRLTRDLPPAPERPRTSGLPAHIAGTASGAASFIEQAHAEWQEGVATGEFRAPAAAQRHVDQRWDLLDITLVAVPAVAWLIALLVG